MISYNLFLLGFYTSLLSIAKAQVHPLVGEWSPYSDESTCSVTDSSCCCADSPMFILPSSENYQELVFSGRVIGDGCRGQTYLSGNFSILSATEATIKQFGQTLNATLQDDDTIDMVTSANNCVNTFVRKATNTTQGDLPPIRVLPVINETTIAHRWIAQGEYYQVEALFPPSTNVIWNMMRFLIQSDLYQLSLGGTERLGKDADTGIWYSRPLRLPNDTILTYAFLYNDNTTTYNSSFYILNTTTDDVFISNEVDLSGEGAISLTSSTTQVEEDSVGQLPPTMIGVDEVVSAVWAEAREAWLGEYRSDGSCVPSNRCCCSTKDISVSIPEGPSATPATAMYVRSATDGGVACFRREELSGLCYLVNEGQAQCEGQESKDAPVIRFNLSLTGSQLRIENSMYECDSVGEKIVEGMDVASSSSSLVPPSFFTSSSLLLLFCASLLF